MERAFISYVSENTETVDLFCQELESRGIQIWRDRNDINPGARWKQVIREAIRQGAFFIACFSEEYNNRGRTYMNEEVTIAIEELRQQPTDRIWFIPVKLNSCEIPNLDIGKGETLQDLQHVDLYKDWDVNIQRILKIVQPASSEPINASTSEQPINQNAETCYDLGNAYNDGGNYDPAIENFNEAIKLKPDFAAAYTGRGLVYRNKRNYDRAIEDHTKAIELNPNYADAYFNRGNTYTEKDDFDLAIVDFTKAIELKPDFADVYNNRGMAYRKKGNLDRAIADFTKAIELKPDFTHAHENLQYCLQQKKQA